jgi:hypothetical protein
MARFMMFVIVLHLIIRIWPSLYFHCFLYFTPFAIDMVDFFLRCDYTSLFWTLSWINVGLHGFRVWVWHFVLLLKFWREKRLPKAVWLPFFVCVLIVRALIREIFYCRVLPSQSCYHSMIYFRVLLTILCPMEVDLIYPWTI